MGRNITKNIFFVFLQLAKKLKDKQMSLIGTKNQARQEISDCVKLRNTVAHIR